jgi:hypothetical protein
MHLPPVSDTLTSGEGARDNGYYCDDHVWIRVVFGDRTELHGTAPHPQKVGIQVAEPDVNKT